ncbi:IS110 family transposase [Halobacillus litoralis]|uniref:IS110 family transposase n=1 Tax=Halobacillus litoralis TaxID=45668 RepID=A0A410MF76_9BACI|nr:IS110 family transposase [Halobacillus litoralis]QAS53392.1 IS110 family transposase [Halobacillus litoralis]QAS53427.1 IS110 family transposase [Halobacillus litoralis]
MNHNRNNKINQITEDSLVIGIDIAKKKHYACALDDRGRELQRPLGFNQSLEGFESFRENVDEWLQRHKKSSVLVGFEPTGHYWMNFASFLMESDIPFVVVNPMHVKRTKEFDDNLQTKNDQKDARVIGKLMGNGHFSYPRIPDGVEAELRNGSCMRWKLKEEHARLKNQMTGWLDQYFPEFKAVIKGFGQLACAILKHTPLPQELIHQEVEELALIYKEKAGVNSPAKKTIRDMKHVAEKSIGLTKGAEMAHFEIATLVDQFLLIERRLEEIDTRLNELASQLEEYEHLISIPGIGKNTVSDLLAETGSLKQYKHPRQLIKLAGLTLRENSSGKHEGAKGISKRGRKRLRSLLYRAILPLIQNNGAFQELYQYYITRSNNPLKKKEAMVVLCGKLLKIFFGLSNHQVYFNEDRMKQDLHCLKQAA